VTTASHIDPLRARSLEAILYDLVRGGELEIDDQGRIWRIGYRRGSRNRLHRCQRRPGDQPNTNGYRIVTRRIAGNQYRTQAHRLVWYHHHGEIPPTLEVNHINGDRGDNRPENLELTTHAENILHSTRTLKKGPIKRLTRAAVADIRQRRAAGEPAKAIAADYGLTASYVGRIARGERQR